MRARPWLLAVPLLAGCPIRSGRVQQLLDVDWFGEACAAAVVLGDPAQDARVLQAHAHQGPRFTLRPLDAADVGTADPAYGQAWIALEATWDVPPNPAGEVDGWLELVAPGQDGPQLWTICPPDRCDAAWLAATPHPPLPAPQRPTTTLLDLADVPDTEPTGTDGPPLTFRGVQPPAPSVGAAPGDAAPADVPALWSAPRCLTAGPCTRRFLATPRPASPGAAPGVQVRTVWRHEACEAEALWSAPLPDGPDLAARLRALAPLDLAKLPATAGRLTPE